MKPLKLKLATEVIINITFLMVVAVSLIGLVVFKIVEQSIILERYQAGKAQALTLSRLAAPIWKDGAKPELERIAGLFLAPAPGEATRGLERGNGAERVILVDMNLEPAAIVGINDRAPIREIERSLILSALSSRTTLLDLRGGTAPGYLARMFLTPPGPLRVAAPVISGDQVLGGVLLSFPLQGLRASIIRSQRIILFYLLLDIVLMLGLGIFLVNRLAVRPIRNLAQVTERVAEGDLSARVKVVGTNEIGTLAVSFNRMVDRIREAQERLLASQQQMVQSEKLASVGRMAAGLAHELGNPLSALLGYADILLKSQELGPEERDLVSRLRNEGLRIDRTIRGMLEFARPAAIELKEINVNEALSHTVDLVRGRKLAREIDFQVSPDPGEPRAEGDPNRLEQVLVNLILNAVDAIGEKGIPGCIRIETRAADGKAEISVSDNGVGIGPGDLNKIFDPFFTTKAQDKGTGLGLTVSLQLIRSMGGNIRVESIPGEGSVFTISLPSLLNNKIL
ncbi:MAG: ATP-binding protein [bacterium]|nr:ATP-binding protein [bacterium]